MSGSKTARTELNRQIAEALRVQREHEEKVRRAAELQRRDAQRLEAARLSARGTREVLQLASDIVAAAGVAQGDERTRQSLALWDADRQAAYAALAREEARLPQAAEDCARAVADWNGNPESYRGGHVDGIDFAPAKRLAEKVLQAGKRLAASAEAQADGTDVSNAPAEDRASESPARESLEAALGAARESLASLDRNLLIEWTPEQLLAIEQELQTLERSIGEAATSEAACEPDETMGRIAALESKILTLRTTADERYAKEQSRKTVVAALMKSLASLRYTTGARLVDESRPLSKVAIDARHPTGRTLSMRVDIEGRIELQMADGIKGADCVAEAKDLMKELSAKGVEMTMTDWGTATAKRVSENGRDRPINIADPTFGRGNAKR
jgi:hypothetical protein